MLKKLRAAIDLCVPPEDKVSTVENRKGRFFVAILIFTAIVGTINMIFFLTLDEPNILGVLGSGIAVFLLGAMLIAYRSIGRRVLLINIFNVLSYILITSLIYFESGGIYSSDIVFMIAASSWTYLLGGKRSGIAWFIISFLLIVYFYSAEMEVQGNSPFLVALLKLPPEYNLMNFCSAIWFVYLIVAVHQRNNDSYLEEIHRKQSEIEQKNREITDSINYARRLQEAILPPMQHVKATFNDYFVFYRPKDIVAGDFYWMEQRDHHVFFAVADCTGHGVPGALVSVVCSNALNHAVREFKLTEPGEILDKVSSLVQDTFAKSGNDVNDGMDIALIAVNTKVREVKYAGANNHIWFVQNGEVKEIRADKQPVGRFEYRKHFTTHTVNIHSGDVVYMFTDGFADQFGGPKGKKYKYRQLQKTLLAQHTASMEKQETELAAALHNWRGNLEQVDDICVVGIRFN